MARSVTFGGQTQFRPGGLTRINANAMSPLSLTATGIVALLGEADGGTPGTVIQIDDPALAKQTFRSGALADAIKIAFGPSGDPRIPGGAFRVLAYKCNTTGCAQASTTLPSAVAKTTDTTAAGSTSTVVNITTGGLTVDAEIGRWFEVTFTTGAEKRRIVDNAASSVTVSPAFSGAPTAGLAAKIMNNSLVLTAKDYGLHTNQISAEFEAGSSTGYVVTLAFEDTVEQSAEIGGTSYLDLKYVGGPIADTGTISTATTSTITIDVGAAPTLNEYQNMLIRCVDGLQRKIASNTAADPTVLTLTSGHELTSAQATALASTSASIINVTSATASITGANGVATGLTSVVAPTNDALAITFTSGMTLRQLVDEVNATSNYEATIPDGVNGDTTLMSSFDFGTRNTTVSVAYDRAIAPTTNNSFRRDLQVAVDWINQYSTLISAAKSIVETAEGAQVPVATGGVYGTVRDVPVYLTGGARGTSINSNWQTGFDQLMLYRYNHIVPLISQDLANEGFGSTATVSSVAQQLLAQVQLGRGMGKNEQGGYMGFKGTLTQVLAQANALNDGDVELIPQQMAFLDVDGNLTLMDEWASAVAAAGMRSGTLEVGEPLTYKYIKTSQLSQDNSWTPRSRTDVNKLIQNGVMFAETAPGGIRWVRDLTTYIKDDNIAFMDGNTREAVRYIAYDLRQTLEDRFTGLKATPATVSSIQAAVLAKMSDYRNQNIIVDSLDPETLSTTVPGWRNLRVFIDGNVATIRIEIFPCVGIVFELNDIYLQLPRMAA